MEPPPPAPAAAAATQEQEEERGDAREEDLSITCKRCGYRLAVAAHLAPHEPGPGQLAFSWAKRQKGSDAGQVVCTSLFVEEQLPWMGDLAEVEGKLFCPHCAYRVGAYHWSGAQCSCGHWSTPAIQLHKSRVDERRINE